MKFAHLADLHIGAWRDPALKNLNLEAFKKAADIILEKQADFVLIAGDLFNTAMPGIDHLKETVIVLKKLKQKGIPVYIVPGSHDYSPTGKTILDVLEEAELLINVMKGKVEDGILRLEFTTDEKTGARITGLKGRKGSLEKHDFKSLDKAGLEKEEGFKIFMFHTALDELKPAELERMDSMPASEMPGGFDYYAGGHVHIVEQKSLDKDYKNLVYPGPVFPANFSELWKLQRGGFYFYDNRATEFVPLNIKKIERVELSAEGKMPEEVSHELEQAIKGKGFENAIVMLRISGKLKSGKPSDINLKSAIKYAYEHSAYYVMRNTSGLSSREFEEIKVSSGTVQEIEEELISEQALKAEQMFNNQDQEIIKSLFRIMGEEQHEGEKKYEYEARVKKEADETFGLSG